MWSNFILFLVVLLGGFLRFYKLDWGGGYFFHPDEYHIAFSVNQLSFPSQMNPHFFSYGSFPIYLIYFSKLLLGFLNSRFLMFNPVLIGRFYSALFSTLTIIIIFLITKKLFKNKLHSYFAAFLAAFTPGLIQQAHFATPESILTFWLFLTLYLGFEYLDQKKLKFLYFSAASLGLAFGTKVVALTFLPILVLPPLINQRFKLLKRPVRLIKLVILPLLIVSLTFLFIFPYGLIAWQDFRHSMNYEVGLGRGKLVVFYTRQFIRTMPVFFQYQKIFPYALGPGILALGTLGFLAMLLKIMQAIFRKKTIDYKLLILMLAFLSYFLPNAFLFAKWTRFIAPTFPFFAIFTGYVFSKISKNRFLLVAAYLLLIVNLLWTLMFFSIYLRPDVRIAASFWINKNLAHNSFILTEAGNMLEVPLKGDFKKVSFDFYHLEENSKLLHQLPKFLDQADYFIIQSRRIFINHQRLPEQFPKTARFYDLLFSDQLGFEKIKEFSSYPQLWSLKIPDELAEETWSVFDHPVIRIYQKVSPLSKEAYEKIIQI